METKHQTYPYTLGQFIGNTREYGFVQAIKEDARMTFWDTSDALTKILVGGFTAAAVIATLPFVFKEMYKAVTGESNN